MEIHHRRMHHAKVDNGVSKNSHGSRFDLIVRFLKVSCKANKMFAGRDAGVDSFVDCVCVFTFRKVIIENVQNGSAF